MGKAQNVHVKENNYLQTIDIIVNGIITAA